MIVLQNISVRYGQSYVVRNISARAAGGELIALVGPNGSGKSTLLKAIAGLIEHDGTSSIPKNSRERAKLLAYLTQSPTAPNMRCVADILALGRSPHLGFLARRSQQDNEAIKRAAETCETLALMDRPYGTLSGGEKMRVHLSRALATDAPILLADEPITALDPYYQISVMNILRQIADQGKIVIAALHDLDYAKRFADRIWVMQGGKLVADDIAPKSLKADILESVFRITETGEIVTSSTDAHG